MTRVAPVPRTPVPPVALTVTIVVAAVTQNRTVRRVGQDRVGLRNRSGRGRGAAVGVLRHLVGLRPCRMTECAPVPL